MKINSELKAFLVRLRERVPAEKREEFARNIRTKLEAIEIDDLVGYVIAGAVVWVETSNAKLRLFRVPDLLSAAFILATLALVSTFLFR